MKFINKLFCKISSIYKNDIIFFTIIFILLFITDAYYNFKSSLYIKSLLNITNAYVLATFACLILSFIRHKTIKKTFKFFIILYLLLYAFTNFYSISLTLRQFNNGVISLILSTNINEAYEFIKSYVSTWHIIIAVFIIYLIIIISQKRINLTSNIAKIPTSIFLICAGAFIIDPHTMDDTPIGRLYIIFKQHDTILWSPNLTLYKSNPNLVQSTVTHPENIVVIIGESFAKTHSSLYDYDKRTNPLLENHQKDSNLYVFKNVTSPESHTIEVFKSMMSTFSYERSDNEWYTYPTIQECFSNIGYKTIWISTQKKHGAFDNIPTRFAQLSDTTIFIQNRLSKLYYDEAIASHIEEKQYIKELFFLHIMGQHSIYSERYPDKFCIFKENEYFNLPKNQRKKVSEYDNATLYNDYVIDSIINIFSKKEAIILYFSDHGQDIYFSDNDYCGHGITANAKSDSIGRDIPFMIYTSPKFKDKYPSLIEKIKKSTNKKFNIEDIIYTLIDISGYKFKDNNDVEKYSIFSN